MFHFAGAVAIDTDDASLWTTAIKQMRAAFAQRIRGRLEAHQDARSLMLLERRPSDLPSGFRHDVVARADATVMLSGVLYGDAIDVWDRIAAASVGETHSGGRASLDPSALRRLYGDYSVAVWHRPSRELTLFSSFMGVMPLFYMQAGGAIFWSSNLGVLRDLLASHAIDRPYLIAFLTMQRIGGRTSYSAVQTAPPGATIVSRLTSSGVVTKELETLTFTDRDLVLRDEREYAERLYELVTEGVVMRTPPKGFCYVESSGGLDSSTIALVAGRVPRGDHELRGVHYTSGSCPEWDERRYADLVGRCANLETDIIDIDRIPLIDLADGVALDPSASHMRNTAKLIRARGGEVVLSGRIGDLVFGNSNDNALSALDHLRRGHLSTFATSVIDWSISANKPAMAIIARMFIARFLPALDGRLIVRDRRARRSASVATSGRQHVQDHSIHATALQEMGSHPTEVNALAARFVRTSKRRMLAGVLESNEYRRLENTLDDSLVLYPYADHRFIEFILSIPPELHCKPGRPRYLMRRSFADVWPPELQRRFSKGFAAPVTLRLFKPYGESLARQKHFALADMNVLDVDSLRKRLASYLGGASLRIGNLTRIWHAEEWLRRLTGQPSLLADREQVFHASSISAERAI